MEIVHRRVRKLIDALEIDLADNPLFDYYYGLVDFEFWMRKYVGDDLVAYLKKNVHPLDIVFRLAEDHGIVLMNGGGFQAPDWSARVSFANLNDDVYEDIGRATRAKGSHGVIFQAFEASAKAWDDEMTARRAAAEVGSRGNPPRPPRKDRGVMPDKRVSSPSGIRC